MNMTYKCHHLEKFCFANIDYIDEIQEKHRKAVVLIAGASSSGKSFGAAFLYRMLVKTSHTPLIISLDSYNVGLSGIIPNKVNLNYFNNSLSNMATIRERIRKIIYNVPFEEKYSDDILVRIKDSISDLLSEKELNIFIPALKEEWAKINFDEPTVYDMKEAYEDIVKLLDDDQIEEKKYSKVLSERVRTNTYLEGKDYDVIIVEGIYALDDSFISYFKGSKIPIITNFVDGNAKSLFLRRVIRDKQITSADSIFTIQLYFKYILKAYYETILPSRDNADIILNNDMAFSELKEGELYMSKDEICTEDKAIYSYLKKNGQVLETTYQKDIYFITKDEDESIYMNNILRFRLLSDDKGKTYYPSSLVHKGTIKLRKDNKVIRPINVLLNENEIRHVWKDEKSCIKDFEYAGFKVGKVVKKVNTKLLFKGQKLTLKEFSTSGSYIEFNIPHIESTIEFIKNKVNIK